MAAGNNAQTLAQITQISARVRTLFTQLINEGVPFSASTFARAASHATRQLAEIHGGTGQPDGGVQVVMKMVSKYAIARPEAGAFLRPITNDFTVEAFLNQLQPGMTGGQTAGNV